MNCVHINFLPHSLKATIVLITSCIFFYNDIIQLEHVEKHCFPPNYFPKLDIINKTWQSFKYI